MSTVSGLPTCPSVSLESIGSSPMVSQVEDGEEVAGPSLNKGEECPNLHALADLCEQSSKGKGVLKSPRKTHCSSRGRLREMNRVVSQNKMRRATGSAAMPARLILRSSPPPPSPAMPARLILRSSPPPPSSAMPARLILRSSPPPPQSPPQSINPLVVNLTRPRSRPRAPSPQTTPFKRFAAPSTSTISRYNQFPAPAPSRLKTFFPPSNPSTPYTPLSEQPLTPTQPLPLQASSPPPMLGFEQFSIAPRFNLFSEQPSTQPPPPQAPSPPTRMQFGPFSAPGPQASQLNPFLEQPLTPKPLPQAPSTLPTFSFGPFPSTNPPTSRSNPFMVQSTSQPQPQLPSPAHAMANNWSRPNVVSTELGLAVGNQRVQRWPEVWRRQRMGPSNAEWMEFVEGLQFNVAGVGRRDPRPMSDEELKLKL